MIYVSGPGHGGPAVVANTYLEGTYSEVYPDISQDEAGLRKLFKQFSFPGGIPSHASPECPGSIHEGGELGYSLSHAFGAVFDNPDLVVACVVGDGEAETGPLATAWHSNKFLDPATDGAVLPILHLNGYKIANPTLLARITREELEQLFRGYGWTPYFVAGHEPAPMHEAMAATLDTAVEQIKTIQRDARAPRQVGASALADDRPRLAQRLDGAEDRRWPADRGHVPGAPGSDRRVADDAPRASHAVGRLAEELSTGGALRRSGPPRSRNWPTSRPRANGAWARIRTPMAASCCAICEMPDFREYAVDVAVAGSLRHRRYACARSLPARRGETERRAAQFPGLRPRRDHVERPRGPVRSDAPAMGRRRPRRTMNFWRAPGA